MKIIHFARFSPNLSGLYEFTKDQIKYERKAGITSELCNPYSEEPIPEENTDGWLTIKPWTEAEDADIWVMHSMIPLKLDTDPKYKRVKRIVIMHGIAEYMLMREVQSSGNDTDFNFNINMARGAFGDVTYDRAVAVNEHDYEIMKMYDNMNRLVMIHDAIDLERFSSEGSAFEYQYHPAIISADSIRIIKMPAHIIWAMPKITEKIPNARLSLFGLPLQDIITWRNLICRCGDQKFGKAMENVQLVTRDLPYFTRNADIKFNNNIGGTPCRSVMEAMAMGVPVISYNGDYTEYHAKIWDINSIAETVERLWNDLQTKKAEIKQNCVEYAKKHFNMEVAVQAYKLLYEEVLK